MLLNSTCGSGFDLERRSSLKRDLKLDRLFLPPEFDFLPVEVWRYLDFLLVRGVMKLNLYLFLLEGVSFTDLTIFVLVLTC